MVKETGNKIRTAQWADFCKGKTEYLAINNRADLMFLSTFMRDEEPLVVALCKELMQYSTGISGEFILSRLRGIILALVEYLAQDWNDAELLDIFHKYEAETELFQRMDCDLTQYDKLCSILKAFASGEDLNDILTR